MVKCTNLFFVTVVDALFWRRVAIITTGQLTWNLGSTLAFHYYAQPIMFTPLTWLQICLDISTNNLINGLGHSLNVLLVQPRNIDSTARWEVDVVAVDQRFALGRRKVKVSMAC